MRHHPRILTTAFVLGLTTFGSPILAAGAPEPLRTDSATPAPPTMQRALGLVDAMDHAWAGVRDYTKVLSKTERLRDGTVTIETAQVKFRRPNQIYFGVIEGPNAGSEILFPKTGTADRAIAHRGGVTGLAAGLLARVPGFGRHVPTEFAVNDPRVVQGQHHTVLDSCLGNVIGLVGRNLRRAAAHHEGTVRFLAPAEVEGHACWRMELQFPAGAGTVHRVRPGDTLWSIAQEHEQDMYVILYNNPTLADPRRLVADTRIFVPRYYAPRSVVWICRETSLPRRIEVYDRAGNLYEAYTHSDVHTNVGLTGQDFDPANEAYAF